MSSQVFSDEYMAHVKRRLPGYPEELKFLCRPGTKPRLIVPLRYQERLTKATHEEILHLGFDKVRDIIKTLYYRPDMDKSIEKVVRECATCLESTVRRRHLHSLAF